LISPGNKGTRIVCGCTKSVNHNTEWVKRRETGDGRRETHFADPTKKPHHYWQGLLSLSAFRLQRLASGVWQKSSLLRASCPRPIGPASGCHNSLRANYSMILATTPAPTVRPPSRIAKRRPSSIAIG